MQTTGREPGAPRGERHGQKRSYYLQGSALPRQPPCGAGGEKTCRCRSLRCHTSRRRGHSSPDIHPASATQGGARARTQRHARARKNAHAHAKACTQKRHARARKGTHAHARRRNTRSFSVTVLESPRGAAQAPAVLFATAGSHLRPAGAGPRLLALPWPQARPGKVTRLSPAQWTEAP